MSKKGTFLIEIQKINIISPQKSINVPYSLIFSNTNQFKVSQTINVTN
jgi:hypothetical protein